MDRLIYVAMSGAKQAMLAQDVNANNLANTNTVGFKADQSYFKSLYLNGPSYADRSYDIAEGNGVDLKQGSLNTTGRPLDVALDGDAWLAVSTPDGSKGYVHSASLHVNENGVLVTQQGFAVHSSGGFAITVPFGSQVSIDKQGGINIQRDGQNTVISRLKVVSLPEADMHKGAYGLMQVSEEGAGKVKPVQSRVLSGVLEQSNVSPVASLVSMIDIARQYETNINMLSTARTDDKSSNQLLSVR